MKIALSGKMQSGKTTLASYMEERYGFGKFSFASVLKERLISAGLDRERAYVKKDPTARALMQVYGRAMREQDPAHWVDALLSVVGDHEDVVIDDLRYLNEAEALRDLGYLLVRVEKLGPTGLYHGWDDDSELDLDEFNDWDLMISAERGDFGELFDPMDSFIEEHM